jgi:hypothetical protein
MGVYYVTKAENARAHSTVRVMGQDSSGLLVEQIHVLEKAMLPGSARLPQIQGPRCAGGLLCDASPSRGCLSQVEIYSARVTNYTLRTGG